MITIPGQLAIKSIHGRFGKFNVGRLSTSIGVFVVKNAELDQFNEGKYDGEFVITWIDQANYATNGRSVTEVRATLGGMALSGIDSLSSEEAETLTPQEVDPVETEAQQPTVAPPPKKKQRPKADPLDGMKPFGMEVEADAPEGGDGDDEKLFGLLWPLGDTVKLDSTVNRLLYRQQIERLGELGYEIDHLSQSFCRKAQ